MAENEQDDFEPNEEVGVGGCEVSIFRTSVDVQDLEEPFEEAPRFSEEIQEAYAPEPERMVLSDVDGLPVPADERQAIAFAAPFTIDHVICVEDDREFVEVFRGEDADTSESVNHYKIHLHSKEPFVPLEAPYKSDGSERIRRSFSAEKTVVRFGFRFGVLEDGRLLLVRPKRERCIHYKRQIVLIDGEDPNPEVKGNKKVYRNCMARRSVGGAYLAIGDEAIFACDYRDPPEPASIETFLDGPDRAHLRSDAHTIHLPLFRKE